MVLWYRFNEWSENARERDQEEGVDGASDRGSSGTCWRVCRCEGSVSEVNIGVGHRPEGRS